MDGDDVEERDVCLVCFAITRPARAQEDEDAIIAAESDEVESLEGPPNAAGERLLTGAYLDASTAAAAPEKPPMQ